MLTLEEAKKYLRIDELFTEDDTEIEALITAAESFIKNATDKEYDNTNELAKLAVKLLIVHWYESREPVGQANKLAFSLDTILTQLKYCYEETGDTV